MLVYSHDIEAYVCDQCFFMDLDFVRGDKA